MSLFEGKAPPNVKSTETVTATAPGYLTDYLTDLAKIGQAQLGMSGADLVAGQSPLQQQAYAAAPAALTRYQAPLSSAVSAGQAAARPSTTPTKSGWCRIWPVRVLRMCSRPCCRNCGVLLPVRALSAAAGMQELLGRLWRMCSKTS